MKKWLGMIVLGLCSSPVFAGGYAGIDYTFTDIEPHYTTSSANVGAMQFKFGSWLNPEQTFGAEVRAAIGTNGDTLNGTRVELDRYYGAYLRGEFPDSLPIRPYGLLGATRVETTAKANGRSTGENYSDISLGLGAELTVQKNVFVSLEYLRAVDRGGDQVSNLSLGVGGRF